MKYLLSAIKQKDLVHFLPRETWTEKDRAWLELAVSIQSIDFLASFSLANQLKKKGEAGLCFLRKTSESWLDKHDVV